MKLKRMLAFWLAAVMMLSLFGCADKQTEQNDKTQAATQAGAQDKQTEAPTEAKKDPVELVWWYSGNGMQKDTEMVQEAFNELLHTFEGMEHVSVVLNTVEYSDYANSIALARSADEPIDIVQTYKLDFAKEVADGNLIALDDILENYPKLKGEFAEWIWNLCASGHSVYAVPCLQRAANLMYFTAPKEYVDKYGDADEFRAVFGNPDSTIEDYAALLEEWIVKVRAGEGNSKYLAPLANYYIATSNDTRCLADPFDKLTGAFILPADSTEVGSVYTDETRVKAYEITADWYEKGYVFQDMASVKINDYVRGNMMNEESFIYCVSNGIGTEEMQTEKFSTSYGFDCYAFPIATPAYVAHVWAAGGNAISSTCKNVDEAMRLLEIINTEEGIELYNMLIYGIEGVHYTKIDDTHIQTLHYDNEEGDATVPFAGKKWLLGNTNYAWINQGGSDETKQAGIDLNNSDELQVSKLAGFTADTSKIETQLSQVSAVNSEYAKTLYYGVKGDEWEKTYNDYLNALDAAGYQEIIDELQRQVDEFLK